MKLDKATLDALKKKGHLKEETYNTLVKKYADGGAVASPSQIQSQNPVEPLQQVLSPTVGTPEVQSMSPAEKERILQEQIEKAKANTVVQAAKDDASIMEKLAAIGRGGFLTGNEEGRAALSDIAQGGFLKPNIKRDVLPEVATKQQMQPEATTEEGMPIASVEGVVPSQASQPKMPSLQDTAMSMSTKATDKLIQAELEGAAAGAKAATEQATYLETIKAEQERMMKADEAQRIENQNLLNEQLAKVQQSQEEYAKAAQINPNKFWADRSTGDKIMASVGIFLGGLAGGENQALRIVNNAIERDIQAQKANADVASNKVSMQNNIYSQMMQKFGNEAQALAATRASMLGLAEIQLKSIAARSQGAQAMANAKKGIAAIELEKAKAVQEFAKAQSIFGTGQGDFAKQYANLPENMRDQAVRLPDGKLGIAISSELAKKTSAALEASKNTEKLIDDLDAVAGLAIPFTQKKARIDSLSNQLLLAIKNTENLGALDKGSVEVGEKIIGDQSSIFSGAAKARLKDLKSQVQNKRNSVLSQNIVNYKPLDIGAAQ